jgi:hypothetical protein
MKPAKMIATLAIAGGLAVGAVGGAGVANADGGNCWDRCGGGGHGWHGHGDGGGGDWGRGWNGGGWNGGGWNGGGWNGGGWNGGGWGGGPCVTGPLGFVTVCA